MSTTSVERGHLVQAGTYPAAFCSSVKQLGSAWVTWPWHRRTMHSPQLPTVQECSMATPAAGGRDERRPAGPARRRR